MGKVANLIALASAGFPVPDGIVFVVREYDDFLARHGLKAKLLARRGDVDFGDQNA